MIYLHSRTQRPQQRGPVASAATTAASPRRQYNANQESMTLASEILPLRHYMQEAEKNAIAQSAAAALPRQVIRPTVASPANPPQQRMTVQTYNAQGEEVHVPVTVERRAQHAQSQRHAVNGVTSGTQTTGGQQGYRTVYTAAAYDDSEQVTRPSTAAPPQRAAPVREVTQQTPQRTGRYQQQEQVC